MIRVIKEAVPDSLASRSEQETRLLCEAQQGARELEFKARVYGHQDVRQALWRSQEQKCCYCEERINLRGAEVDHYRPKAGVRQARGAPEVRPGYFWLAYQWDNLYLACHECNVIWKGSLFPLRDEQQRARSPRDSLAQEAPLLLDPGHDDPDEHISWRDEVPRGITTPGQTTIAVLGLDRDDGVAGRLMLLERRRQLWSQVHQVCLLLRSPLPPETAKELTEKLLAMAMPAAPFSAMVRAELRRQGVLRSGQYHSASGQYHSANEVVREGLRLLEERDQLRQVRLEQLRQDIAVGIAQADAGEATALSMDDIKSEGRRLLGERSRAR